VSTPDAAEIAAQLARDGFAVVVQPPCDVRDAYDAAVRAADPRDVGHSSSTRVHDFVNRGEIFDRFWRDPRLLAIAEHAFDQPFKLSSFLSRTILPGAAAQPLHADLARDGDALALLGFVWMVDEFRADNGATRFVPGSHRGRSAAEVLALGPPGTLVVHDGAVQHGFSANRSTAPRRSLQGAFIRRTLPQGVDQRSRLRADTAARLDARARHLLDVE
jgi:hypothetical protein